MRSDLAAVLAGLQMGADGIYAPAAPAGVPAAQADERRAREAAARAGYPDLLSEIARHHSIPVMDREIASFLRGIPSGGVVADVGGGWGWHWRTVHERRPDVWIVIVDFVRDNLRRAADLLGGLVNRQVVLVHADATALPFPPALFDGFWTVQAFQHIPEAERAVVEAERVLRPGGAFACYWLNRARLVEAVYRVLRRPYLVAGEQPGRFHLQRAARGQARAIERVFRTPVTTRYSEMLFHPDLRLRTGAPDSWIAQIDARLSGTSPLWAPIARQRSYHARKAS